MEASPWIINQFDKMEVEIMIFQEELLELSTNEDLKQRFKRDLTPPVPFKDQNIICTLLKIKHIVNIFTFITFLNPKLFRLSGMNISIYNTDIQLLINILSFYSVSEFFLLF